MTDKKSWTTEDADKYYQISSWGNGYFEVAENGNLSVRPEKNHSGPRIDVQEVIAEMQRMKIPFPAVIRFHDILRAQVKNLNQTFRKVIEESRYEGRFMGVYPIKVNQMREVVEEIVDAGTPFHFGLEAGSKPELMSVLALNNNRDSLTILNGYKDEDYLRLACLGLKLGRRIVVVIEKYSELVSYLKLAKQYKVKPEIGVRCKMSVKGRGKWAESGGDRAKFGLTIPELIKVVQTLEKENMLDSLKLFHFHIGSQITDIKTIKDAITEGTRIYARLIKMGAQVEFMDVGGGLGVDYDGSKSTNESSINYALEDYCEDIIYGIQQICDIEDVPHPNVVSESGRYITAHHSCVVFDVFDSIETSFSDFDTRKVTGEHHLVGNMRELVEELSLETTQNIFNEAVQLKEESLQAFRLGVISLEERAKIETLFWQIMSKVNQLIPQMEFVPEGLVGLEETLSKQYLCNFSVFQSAADSWAIDQLLPVCPISRLNEEPTVSCSLADITCDSDGKINKFIDREESSRRTIHLHELKNDEDYYVGLFLTGAYQDVMGDMHNLFGRLNEVHVFCDDDDPTDFYIEETIRGNTASQVLSTMQYNPEILATDVKRLMDKQIQRGKVSPREGVRWVDFYEDCLSSYTYLSHE